MADTSFRQKLKRLIPVSDKILKIDHINFYTIYYAFMRVK